MNLSLTLKTELYFSLLKKNKKKIRYDRYQRGKQMKRSFHLLLEMLDLLRRSVLTNSQFFYITRSLHH